MRWVCWNWYHLLNDCSVWKTIDLTEDSLSSKVNNRIIESWVAAWGKTLQHINVTSVSGSQILWFIKSLKIVSICEAFNIKDCFQVSYCGMDERAFNCSCWRKLKWGLQRGLCLASLTVPWPEEYQAWQQRQLSSYAIVCAIGSRTWRWSPFMMLSYLTRMSPLLISCYGDFAPAFHCLTTIDLTWCRFITDDALLAISLCCSIRECHQNSDRPSLLFPWWAPTVS